MIKPTRIVDERDLITKYTAPWLYEPLRVLPASGVGAFVALFLLAWVTLIMVLGERGVFVGPPGAPPLAIAIGASLPLAAFFALLVLWRSFREFMLSVDLRLIAGMQAWRWAGMGFLLLYAYKVLPAAFALTAGLGDMVIGATAPWIILALVRQPGFAAGNRFVGWNLLGIADLLTGVSIAVVSAIFGTEAPGQSSVAPLSTLPLVLVPEFIVPFFLMLHAVALMQSRQLRKIGA